MLDEIINILLDQNIPLAVSRWLKKKLNGWEVNHVNELSFQGKPDDFLYCWALDNNAIIITYDEDFADSRFYPLGSHRGIVRLRVWPTTIENTQDAIERLLVVRQPSSWRNCLIIIENNKIRIRDIFKNIYP